MVVAVRREAQAVILALLGGAMIRISVDGSYLRYLKPGMFIFVLASGVFLLVLGIIGAWSDGLIKRGGAETADASHDHDHDHDGEESVIDDGHGHGPGGPRVAWLMLLPVISIIIIAPPALGAYAVERGTTAAEPSEAITPLPEGGIAEIPVADFVTRAVWDEGRTLKDRPVELTGFVVPRDGGGYDLARLSLNCCAADAVAAKVNLKALESELVPDQWVRVVGKWVPGGKLNDPRAIPVFQVSELEAIDTPKEVYE